VIRDTETEEQVGTVEPPATGSEHAPGSARADTDPLGEPLARGPVPAAETAENLRPLGSVAPPRPTAPPHRDERDGGEEREGQVAPERKPQRRGWRLPWWVVLLAAVVGIGLIFFWRAGRPIPVAVVRPVSRPVTQTVAASGRVGGKHETVVGAQVQGTVAELFVDEGDVVTRGQVLARIRNDVAEAQVRQAEQALRTARAQLVEASAGPRPSEVNASRAQVAQAEATVAQRQAQVDQARAAVTQAEARLELARRTLERNRFLLAQGAIARQTVDQAETEFRAAQADLESARQGVATARANLAAARASVTAARAQLRTLEAGPRAEAVAVARERVREAEAALQVAREQAQNYVVRAPFSGTVTQIVAERGAPVTSNGVVRLVETGRPEIRADVDESNLADLRVGQRVVITSTTFRGARLEGRVTEIGAQVDPARGTVEITVVPDQAPPWLRPGQTVDVNVIIAEAKPRLVLPRSALRREADRTVVLVVRNGRAEAQPVLIGTVEGDQVPVLEGLKPGDLVVRDAQRVEPGARVRPRGVG
jgi:HlyD family secretion protein